MRAPTPGGRTPGEDVVSSGHERTASGRRHRRLAVVVVVLALAAGVLAFVLETRSDPPSARERQRPTRPTVVAASHPPPVTGVVYPIWPFTTRTQALEWQSTRAGGQTWFFDSGQTALRFLRYLEAPEIDTVLTNGPETTDVGAGRAVTVGRKNSDGTVQPVTVVHLVRLGFGPGAPYVVTAATSDYLKVSEPRPAVPIRSPVPARGTVAGDASVLVELRVPSRGTPIGENYGDNDTAGSWAATIAFTTTTDRIGALVARVDSGDGAGVRQLAAQPVILAVPLPATAPATFAAVVNGRIAVLESATGRLVRYLTSSQPGDGDHSPTVTNDRKTVFFRRVAGPCSVGLWRIPYAGGRATQIRTGTRFVSSMTETDNGRRIAYVTGGCPTGRQTVVVRDTDTGRARSIRPGRDGVSDLALSSRYGLALTDSEPPSRLLVLDPRTASTTTEARIVRATNRDCELRSPVWIPVGLAAVENCAGTSRLVVFDPRTLRLRRQGPVLSGPPGVDRFGADAVGNLISAVMEPNSAVAFVVGGQLLKLHVDGCTFYGARSPTECPQEPDW